MTSKSDAAERALSDLREMLKDGKRPGENRLIVPVDIITAKGANEQVLEALELLPALLKYSLPRMLLLRRLMLLGDGFIENEKYMDRFDRIKRLQKEIHALVARFGEQKVKAFLRPAVLRKADKEKKPHSLSAAAPA